MSGTEIHLDKPSQPKPVPQPKPIIPFDQMQASDLIAHEMSVSHLEDNPDHHHDKNQA